MFERDKLDSLDLEHSVSHESADRLTFGDQTQERLIDDSNYSNNEIDFLTILG